MQFRVLAIDPGFDRIGVAVMEESGSKPILLHSECIETNSKDSRGKRLLVIGKSLGKIIKKWKPTSLAVENLFFNKNITSGIGVAEARGVILYEASIAKLEIFEYGPQSIKTAVTGYGRADKTQVGIMVRKLVNLEEKRVARLDDEVDAIALGITHLATQKGI